MNTGSDYYFDRTGAAIEMGAVRQSRSITDRIHGQWATLRHGSDRARPDLRATLLLLESLIRLIVK